MSAPEEDEFTTLMAVLSSAGLLISVVTALAAAMWSDVLAWALAHNVVVPRQDHPALVLPYSEGAGLDTARCFLVAAFVILVLGIAVGSVRRHTDRGERA